MSSLPNHTGQAAFLGSPSQIGYDRGRMTKEMLSFRASTPERIQLDKLATATGRNRSEVLRRLILLAENPAAVELLGKVHAESGAKHDPTS